MSPSELFDLESDALVALLDVVNERNRRQADIDSWTTTHELLAELIEWVSVVRVEQLACAGVKPHKLPKIVHVPRPGETDKSNEVVMSPREFALMTTAAA